MCFDFNPILLQNIQSYSGILYFCEVNRVLKTLGFFAFAIITAILVKVYSYHIMDRRRVYPESLHCPLLSLSELYLDSYTPGDPKRHEKKHQCISFLGKKTQKQHSGK